MNKLRENPNYKDSVYITTEQACKMFNLGRNTVRELAKESGAARKIHSKCVRINKDIFIDYIENNYVTRN